MTTAISDAMLDQIIVCPSCDAAYQLSVPAHNQRAVCARCHATLISPRRKAGMQIISVAVAVVVLVIAATCFPFLSIRAAGASNSVSILETALAFHGGLYGFLALVMIALIVVIPFLRAALSIYVLYPVVMDKPHYAGAKTAFRWVEALRPWSMAEIFALGCAVALIKVADLADIRFGAAFWMFCGLVALVIAQDSFLCRWSVWTSLTAKPKS